MEGQILLYCNCGCTIVQEFYKEEDAKRAIKKLNKEDLNGYTLLVEMAKGKKQNSNICYACGRSGHL